MAEYNLTLYPVPKRINPRMNILTGQRFHRLTVLGFAGVAKTGKPAWHCLCDCGITLTVLSCNLGRSQKSCGCLRKERSSQVHLIHGETTDNKRTPEYNAYCQAKKRCNNLNGANYADYGGRGIEFRFTSFNEFLVELGRRPPEKDSVDRIDNEGHYQKGNVKWSTQPEQNQNTRKTMHLTAFGKTQCLNEWAREVHLLACTIWIRLKYHWCIECALTIPVRSGTCHHKNYPVVATNC